MKVGWGSGVGPDLQVPELQTKSSGKQTQPNNIDKKKGFHKKKKSTKTFFYKKYDKNH